MPLRNQARQRIKSLKIAAPVLLGLSLTVYVICTASRNSHRRDFILRYPLTNTKNKYDLKDSRRAKRANTVCLNITVPV